MPPAKLSGGLDMVVVVHADANAASWGCQTLENRPGETTSLAVEPSEPCAESRKPHNIKVLRLFKCGLKTRFLIILRARYPGHSL